MPIGDEEYELIERRIMAKIVDRDLELVVKEHFRKYLVKVGIVIVTVAATSMLYVASNVAEDIARDVASRTAAETSAREIAKKLVSDPDLKAELGDSIFSEIGKLNGAVVAFDGVETCPEGWTAYEAGEGRVIVGVGATKDDRDETRAIEPGELAGEFSHILKKEEMPAHNHTGQIEPGGKHNHGSNPRGVTDATNANGAGGTGGNWRSYFARISDELDHRHQLSINEEGGGKSHNNMPPYIALYFCKKSLGPVDNLTGIPP